MTRALALLAVLVACQPARDHADPVFFEARANEAWHHEMIVVVLDRDSTTEAERAEVRARIYGTPNARVSGRTWTRTEPVWDVMETDFYAEATP